ncbi:MAG TPA: zinc-binding dehydrogenase, partial [Hyphomonadaceae bacterium]|nr:zinc-binding dehydrogenase [Hyphomonadaceae bacterium]
MALEGLQLRSLMKKSGELELSLAKVQVADPAPDEIVVRIEGSPINPSDLGLLIGPADLSTAVVSGSKDLPVVTAKVPEMALRAMAARLDESMPVGNEGAGTVVAAGSSPEAQALLGKLVAILGGEMYATYRTVKAKAALPLPAGATATDGASCFVNPLTALAMVKTMQLEGHTALVHTAAASNLGQMLNKICIKDGVQLVNIVRSDEQAKILKDIGAKHIVDSSKPTFTEDLIAALVATGATLAFDAVGGGKLAGQILGAMEIALNSKPGAYSRYGSSTHKQVYIYGRLSLEPTILGAAYGMAWGVGGFLLTPFLQKVGMEEAGKMRA